MSTTLMKNKNVKVSDENCNEIPLFSFVEFCSLQFTIERYLDNIV